MNEGFTVLIVFILFLMAVSIIWICRYCSESCCAEKGITFHQAPVVVTTTTQHAPTGRYPVSVEHTPSGGYQATPYPPGVVAQPYPLNPGAMPMPATHPAPYPNVGFQTDVVHGYPPTTASASSNPPSYDQVVTSDSYVKQAPYNPNYTGAPTH